MNDPSKAASIRYSGQWNLSNAATLISGLGGDETNAECAARCEDPVKGRPLSSQKNAPLDLTLQSRNAGVGILGESPCLQEGSI